MKEMMNETKHIGTLYYCIQNKLNEKCGFSKMVTKDFFRVFISRWYKIRTSIVPIIEQEMIDAGLIEKIKVEGKNFLVILPNKMIVEDRVGYLYRKNGLC